MHSALLQHHRCWKLLFGMWCCTRTKTFKKNEKNLYSYCIISSYYFFCTWLHSIVTHWSKAV